MNWDDILNEQEYLEHHGILGMKWGIRRYQNPDGSLTSAGRARYGSGKSIREKFSDYKKKKVSNIKEKTMRSGDIKTILKNQKYLTDTEFDKAIARAKKVDSLNKERHPEKKKEIDEYKQQKKQARTDAIVNERRMIDQVKQGIADKLSGRPKDKEQIDYQIAKQKIDKEKNTKLSSINLETLKKTAKKVIKYWGTYTAVAAAVNKVTDKKTLPTSIGDIADKIKGLKGKDSESDFYTTFVPSKSASQNFSNVASYVSKKQPKTSKVTNSDWVADGSSWFSSDAGKSAMNVKLSDLNKEIDKNFKYDVKSPSSFFNSTGIGSSVLSTNYKDILNQTSSNISVPVNDWSKWKVKK